jgi:hypothetical protein
VNFTLAGELGITTSSSRSTSQVAGPGGGGVFSGYSGCL